MSALELAEVLQFQCRELEKRLIECHHKNTELKKDVQRINEVNEKLRAELTQLNSDGCNELAKEIEENQSLRAALGRAYVYLDPNLPGYDDLLKSIDEALGTSLRSKE